MNFDAFRQWLIVNGIKEERHLAHFDRVARALVSLAGNGPVLPKHVDAHLRSLAGASAMELANAQKVGQSVLAFQKKQAIAEASAAAPAATPSGAAPSPDASASPPEEGLKVRVSNIAIGGACVVFAVLVANHIGKRAQPPPAASTPPAVAEPGSDARIVTRRVDQHDALAQMCAQSLAEMGADDLTIRVECYDDPEAKKAIEAHYEAERKQRNEHPATDIKDARLVLISQRDLALTDRIAIMPWIILKDAEQRLAAAEGKVVLTFEREGHQEQRTDEVTLRSFRQAVIRATSEKVLAAPLGVPIYLSAKRHESSFFSASARFDDRVTAQAQITLR